LPARRSAGPSFRQRVIVLRPRGDHRQDRTHTVDQRREATGTEERNLNRPHGFSGVGNVLAWENTLAAVVRDRYVIDPDKLRMVSADRPPRVVGAGNASPAAGLSGLPVSSCPWKKSSMTFFHLENLRFSRVLRTRDRLVRSGRHFIHSLLVKLLTRRRVPRVFVNQFRSTRPGWHWRSYCHVSQIGCVGL